MDYLKKYGLTDKEIDDVKSKIEESNVDIDLFLYDENRIMRILDVFSSIGVTNIYGILMVNPDMFGENYSYIKQKVNQYNDKEKLAALLNEDAMNLSYLGLY